MIRLLICDDHAIVRQGFRQILADVPDLSVADEAADGAQALQAIRRRGVDVVLLDIALPGRDGLDVLKQVHHEFPKLPVLVVSTYPEKQYALRCLRLGASGYLNKCADPGELVTAIRKVAQGGMFVSPTVAETLALAMRHDAERPPHELLSQREYQVFTHFGAGKTVSQIAETLSLSVNTVSTYRARIMEKISTHNDVETALYAVRHHLVGAMT
ncbi:MAG TPA: response regulator transcription factor [Burkholderiales bacterium]|nr:response regulator transcription factor [Burkholderiales bacterium]